MPNQQPSSLRIFFATEMWERYGFYVVQSLLALYMALHFKWQDQRVYALVGSFTAMTYLSPIVGGWIADHLLGQKRSVLMGAVFLFFSYITLSFMTTDTALMAALAGVAVGTGLLKPNISSLLGNEYAIDSPLRESGFTIFYMGITSGIILGTTLPSQLNNYFGWSVSFASAAIGMVVAFSVFAFGIKKYRIADYHPYQYHPAKLIKAIVLVGALWSISFNILSYPWLANLLFTAVVIMSLLYLIDSIKRETPAQAKKTIVIGLLCVISVVFWAFYFQMFLSLTLFLSRAVKPSLFGIQFPPPYYVGIQSFGMLVFGYFITRSRTWFKSTACNVRTGNKFILAMIFMVIAYALITFICYFSSDSTLLSPLWFIPTYLLIAIAELYLSPVGLAAITALASRKKVSTMMGIFFVSLGVGGFLSGKLANLTALDPNHLSLIEIKMHYAETFGILLIILSIATIGCFILNGIIKKLLV